MLRTFLNGIFRENPVLGLLIGLCPTLAVSVSLKNAVGMGAAATFVLVFSNAIISVFRRFFPAKIRIPCYIVVIATAVSIVEMVMAAYFPALNAALGIFIPLIVVNCIILGRAEAFASKNGLLASMADGLGMGAGFTLTLSLIASIREVIGSGKIWGITLTSFYSPQGPVKPVSIFVMAPGAFIVIACILGFIQWRKGRAFKKECGSCSACGMST